MDEELIFKTTEDAINVSLDDIVQDRVLAEDLEEDVATKEEIEIVEVEVAEEINIDIDEAVGWVGGDTTKHYSLHGRYEPDQHPITSITGLREELNDIEALDVVYSNKRNQADYYLWEDKNILQENRVGYFVSASSDINEIKICTSDNAIFGVTVDGAGFIGAQDDVARDIKYGLVVTNGVVHVRCEKPISVGDYVISNDYGYAQKNKSGYKVVGRHLIDGVEYAEITLVTPIDKLCELTDDMDNIEQRMDDAETNIASAINLANAAYNKAGEVGAISEEAIKNALEALEQSNETSGNIDSLSEEVSRAKEAAVQAKKIAEDTALSAETIRKDAVDTSNKALAGVNELIKDLEPISTWGGISEYITLDTWDSTGKDTSKVYYTKDTKLYYYYYNDEWISVSELHMGASYMTQYIKDDVATKAEIETAESAIQEHTSLIEKNAKGFSTLVASVDKYSVGEYSQAYGLTREQAGSILKPDYIYIPTKHKDTQSHKELFVGESEENWFTPGDYYVWGVNDKGKADWIEHSVGSVWIGGVIPANSNSKYKYWYIDSNNAPDGYEPYALYIWENKKWEKVNTLAGNVNNRITSMIRQTADGIAIEVANTRGSVAALNARITNTELTLQTVASWKSDVEGDVSNIATIKQTADSASASISQVVKAVGSNGQVNAASIVAAVNDSGSTVRLDGDHIILNGAITNDGGSFYISKAGHMTATGGNIAGWEISNSALTKQFTSGSTDRYIFMQALNGDDNTAFSVCHRPTGTSNWTYDFYVRNNGKMYAKNAEIEGKITAGAGSTIGGWTLTDKKIYSGDSSTGVAVMQMPTSSTTFVFAAGGDNHDSYAGCPFRVTKAGKLYATDAEIKGKITATSGSFDREITIGGRKFSSWLTSDGHVYNISATSGRVGNWDINKTYDGCLYGDGGSSSRSVALHPSKVYSLPINGAVTSASWYEIVESATGSDERLKNNIENIDLIYESLFDNLRPKTFYYNEDAKCGDSNNIHFGFVAQDVLNTQNNLGMDNLSFVIKEEYYSIKMQEFIALNTWQIQKAKARITELEEKVARLEALINKE